MVSLSNHACSAVSRASVFVLRDPDAAESLALQDDAESLALHMITIVAIGDSTTAGTPGFRSPLEAPPNGSGNVESQYAHWLMAAHPDWRVMNRGVNGECSDQIRARFTRDAVQPRPDGVVIIA